MQTTTITETAHEISREVRSLTRRRPITERNKSDYAVLAFQLENTARELRLRAAQLGEKRSFKE